MTTPCRSRWIIVAFLSVLCSTVGTAMSSDDLKYTCGPCGCASDDKTFDEAGDCPSCGMPLIEMESGDEAGPDADPVAEPEEPPRLNVAIVIHQGVELLDFAGPAEVFAAASRFASSRGRSTFNVYTVAPTTDEIISQGFLKVRPDYGVADAPAPDILVIPGGATGRLTEDKAFMAWVDEAVPGLEIGLSVCTGAFVFGELGLLDGLSATTWYGAISGLRDSYPEATVHSHVRFVDNGTLVTTAGVSAGIDGALHAVGRLSGIEVARATAQYMEYRWEPQDFLVPEDSEAVWEAVEKFRRAFAGSEDTRATLEGLIHESFQFTGVKVQDTNALARADRAGYLEHFGGHKPGHYPRSGVETVDVSGRMARARLFFTHDHHTMHVTLTLLKLGEDWSVVSQSFSTESQ